MSRTIKAIVFSNPDAISVRSFDLPSCGANEVLCETLYTFVSPGTELRILSGVKEAVGKFPLIPGYSWVGRVVEVGKDVRGWKEGDLVSGRNPVPVPGVGCLWGGQASHHRAAVAGYDRALKLPERANPWSYIAVEVGAISWRATTCAYPAPGETAVVIGQGMVGALVTRWLVLHGVRVIAVDIVASRLARAQRWGAAATVNPKEDEPRERILACAEGGADMVFEASSTRAGVELANTLLRQPVARSLNTNYPVAALHANAHYWPRLVYVATYTHTFEVAPGGLSGNAEGAVILKPGDRTVGDRLAVIEQIRRGDLNIDDIVKEPTPVDDAPQAYFRLRDNPDKYNTIVYQWK